MQARDTRVPCASCDRRDDKLKECRTCGKKICTFCWVLHTNYDCVKPKDDQETKLIDYKPEE